MKNEVSVVHKKIDSVNKELTSYVFCKIGKILTVYHRLYTIYLDCEYSLILDLSQLKDPSFRPHILVQGLILFNYLKSPGKNDKDLPSDTMVWWKRDCCPPFEKPPTEKKLGPDGGQKRNVDAGTRGDNKTNEGYSCSRHQKKEKQAAMAAALSCKFYPTNYTTSSQRLKRLPYISCTVQTSPTNIKRSWIRHMQF
ncbi:hypothetical protein C2S51_015949 [Perilla frutescens var. frutescens]|nr:hypothetical protein C2S51_015949 [Perilla frutescens var. frutescens]